MYCGTCGKELPDGAKFCNGCGAAQPEATIPESQQPKAAPEVIPVASSKAQKPKKEKKKVNKKLLAVVAIVLVVAILAIGIVPLLFPKMVTVYVLTSCTYIDQNGEATVCEFEYDEDGRLIEWQPVADHISYTAEYDEYGNPEEINGIKPDGSYFLAYSFDNSYDSEGRLKKCSQIDRRWSSEPREIDWKFTWNDDQLVRMDMSWNEDRTYRVDFVYDKRGNLIYEYRSYIMSESGENICHLHCLEYTYDNKGNLLLVETGDAQEPADDVDDIDPEDVSFDMKTAFEMDYRKNKLDTVTQYAGSQIREFSYDKDGNLEADKYAEYTYDKHGNLTHVTYETPRHTNKREYAYMEKEFTYEAVKMTPEAASYYYNFIYWWTAWLYEDCYYLRDSQYRARYMGVGGDPYTFYYLVPNPLRELSK